MDTAGDIMKNKHKPACIIDVDEILWGFNNALHALACDKGILLPEVDECDHWDALYKYSPRKIVVPLFDEIHANQCGYLPFPDAEKFMRFMKTHFHVIVASHRNPKYHPELKEWAKINNLVYDEIHTLENKTDLFTPRVTHVIDDRAETLASALKQGKTALGLSRPWNRKTIDEMFLFDTLTDIRLHIQREFASTVIQGVREDFYE
jgi:hypothetical protein